MVDKKKVVEEKSLQLTSAEAVRYMNAQQHIQTALTEGGKVLGDIMKSHKKPAEWIALHWIIKLEGDFAVLTEVGSAG